MGIKLAYEVSKPVSTLDLTFPKAIVRATLQGGPGKHAGAASWLLNYLMFSGFSAASVTALWVISMYAVIKTGGKQYKVASGDLLRVEKLEGAAGESVAFDQVLLLDDAGKLTIGAPLVAGATVTAEIIAQARDPKILIFKKKRRHKYRRKNGHRQLQTVLRVTGIKAA